MGKLCIAVHGVCMYVSMYVVGPHWGVGWGSFALPCMAYVCMYLCFCVCIHRMFTCTKYDWVTQPTINILNWNLSSY